MPRYKRKMAGDQKPRFFNIKGAIVFFVLFYLYLLAPKIQVGGIVVDLGLISAICMVVYFGAKQKINETIETTTPVVLFSLFFLGIHYVSVLANNAPLFSAVVNYQIRVSGYLFLGVLIGLFSIKRGKMLHEVVFYLGGLAVFVGGINSLIIVLEFLIPPLKIGIESLLYQDPGSNINYSTRGNRLRGIAAGGGANLSFFFGVCVFLLWAMFLEKRANVHFLVLATLVFVLAMILVGRTGFVVALIGILLLQLLAWSRFNSVKGQRFLLLGLLTFVGLVAVLPSIAINLFPMINLERAFLFLYEGTEGVREEGTVRVLMNYHFSAPPTLFHAVFGTGDFSGGYGPYSADPGLMKMATGYGVIGALLIYSFLCFFLFVSFRKTRLLPVMLTLFVLILIGEFKEPFLLKGYTARFFWVLLGLGISYHMAFKTAFISGFSTGIRPIR